MIRLWQRQRIHQNSAADRAQDAATRREAEATLEMVDALTAKVIERDRDRFAEAVERAMRRKYGHA
ncbi:Uncharacterised protein [Mycobacteroides abscessus subsp. massiliense]|nr:Uncharacterised protein [Mycobacteroides abscessus subsp. massiliense]